MTGTFQNANQNESLIMFQVQCESFPSIGSDFHAHSCSSDRALLGRVAGELFPDHHVHVVLDGVFVCRVKSQRAQHSEQLPDLAHLQVVQVVKDVLT